MHFIQSKNMENAILREILKRYNEGTATNSEIKLLEAYYKSFDLSEEGTIGLEEQELIKLKAEIRNNIHTPLLKNVLDTKNRRRSSGWMKFSAAAVLLLVSGLTYLYLRDRTTPIENATVHQLQPVEGVLNNFILLSDGSTAFLSAGSKLEVVSNFEQNTVREVVLTGEAYFDVKHNPNKPFIVRTGQLTTKVLGTSFNIKALPNEESIIVTVISGKVQVNKNKEVLTVLLPEEQLVYNVAHKNQAVNKVNVEETVLWKMDDLYCDDITVEQASALISKRYNIEVEVNDKQLKEKRFTTTFVKEESLESVLNSLALFNHATVQLKSEKGAKELKYLISPK